MSVRVPTMTLYTRLQHGLSTSLGHVQSLQSQVANGQRITKLSDDPIGATIGLRLRAQETDWAAYQRSADDATAVLGTADAALQSATALLAKVKDLAISAVNGAYGPAERQALADEIGHARDQMIDVANTQYLGRAIFGGHNRVAYDRQTGAWQPFTGAAVNRQISPAVKLDVNLDATGVFGTGDGDVLKVLAELQASVRDGRNADIAAGQKALEVRFDAVTKALGTVGALTNRITASSELGRNVVTEVRHQRSQVEDIDFAEAIMRLNGAAIGYQAALGAIAKADMPSLASFLR